MSPKITKPQAEIGIIAGFMLIALPSLVGFPNGLISISIIGSLITLISSAFLGHIKFTESQTKLLSESI